MGHLSTFICAFHDNNLVQKNTGLYLSVSVLYVSSC